MLYEIDDEVLINYAKAITKPQLLSDEQIYELIKRVLDKEKELINKIKSYEKVLIYGAGRVGRWLCDYIVKRGYNGDIMFMSSFIEPNYTACGKKVRSILSCVKYKDDALVLIANKNSADQMEENAHKHLFKNVEKIPYEELMLFGADLKEDSYITIY